MLGKYPLTWRKQHYAEYTPLSTSPSILISSTYNYPYNQPANYPRLYLSPNKTIHSTKPQTCSQIKVSYQSDA